MLVPWVGQVPEGCDDGTRKPENEETKKIGTWYSKDARCA